jgi:hypothetical protein
VLLLLLLINTLRYVAVHEVTHAAAAAPAAVVAPIAPSNGLV